MEVREDILSIGHRAIKSQAFYAQANQDACALKEAKKK